jgi:hypothetical protein
MAIDITNNGGSIKVKNGTQVRHISKNQVLEVTVIKNTIIKIDLGKGALQNVFIDYGVVTTPVTGNAAALRDAIADMLTPATGPTGGATEAKQVEEISKLTDLNTAIASLQTLVNTIDAKIFYDPKRVDDGQVELVYKGFSNQAAPDDAQPQWAIQRVRKENGVDVYTWANGDRLFNKVWNDRETLNYS